TLVRSDTVRKIEGGAIDLDSADGGAGEAVDLLSGERCRLRSPSPLLHDRDEAGLQRWCSWEAGEGSIARLGGSTKSHPRVVTFRCALIP
ncbi:hypothetical protein GW17_00052748, partial [Ensete ventricosum]